MEDSDLLTVEEAARELGMVAGAVRRAIHEGRITPRRFSPRVMLIPRAEVERYKRERRPAGRPRKPPPPPA